MTKTLEKSNIDAYSQKLTTMFGFLNVPLSKGVDFIKKNLANFNTSKTVYVVLFVGSIAFIAQGIYALVTTALALLVATWSLKHLMAA